MTSILQPFMDVLQAILDAIHGILPSWMLPWGWAISIIILTVIVRVALLPLTVKQFTSMRAMQKLQPKMKELQAKYKDDKAKLNEEMMKFYRENKVNPFGSCLPLILQMPIFFALYYMLRTQASSGHFDTDNAFLWMSNITQPDTILIFLYIGTQLLSSMLMTTTVDKSQRMMMLIMPVFIGVIFLFSSFPAGVLIYWVTTNIWTIGQQLVVMRIIKAREAAEPAISSGPASRGDRGDRKGQKKSGGNDGGKSKPKSKSGSKSGKKRR